MEASQARLALVHMLMLSFCHAPSSGRLVVWEEKIKNQRDKQLFLVSLIRLPPLRSTQQVLSPTEALRLLVSSSSSSDLFQ